MLLPACRKADWVRGQQGVSSAGGTASLDPVLPALFQDILLSGGEEGDQPLRGRVLSGSHGGIISAVNSPQGRLSVLSEPGGRGRLHSHYSCKRFYVLTKFFSLCDVVWFYL